MDLQPSLLCDFTKSAQPLTGGVQIAYSGGVNGTRFNENGLIVAASAPRLDYDPATARKQWCTWTDDFSNAIWTAIVGGTGITATKTPNFADAPDGSKTACRVQLDCGAGLTSSDFASFGQTTNVPSGTDHTASIWLKSNTSAIQKVRFRSNVNTIDLDVPPYWVRFEKIRPAESSTGIELTTRGDLPTNKVLDLLVWHPQLWERAATENRYLQTFGTPLIVPPTPIGLLMEEARTNLCLRSEEFDNASWSKVNLTVTANATASPDGNVTADKLVETASNAIHEALQNFTVTAGVPYTFSMFLKAAERTNAEIQLFDSGAVNAFPIVNLLTGTVVVANNATVTSQPYPNGWWRFSFTVTPGTTTLQYGVYPALGATNVYLGDGTSGIYAWGAQLEQASSASSYIPTAGTTVTRTSEAPASIPLGTWYNPVEGTIEFEGKTQAIIGVEKGLWNFTGGGGGCRAFIGQGANDTISKDEVNNIQTSSGGSVGIWDSANVNKVSTSYKAGGSLASSANGGTPVTAAGTVGTQTPTSLNLGCNNGSGAVFNGWISKFSFTQKAVDPSFSKQLTQR